MFNENAVSVINSISNILLKFSPDVYVVGGFIRDAFIEVSSKDIDMVINCRFDKMYDIYDYFKQISTIDAVDFVEDFNNIKIKTDSYYIDIVPLRKETYLTDSHKPIIEKGTFVDDLLRRDFTVNSIYLKLLPSGKSVYIDPLNGILDIRNKILRINYCNSFRDDPTRMYRAIKYKNRLEFKVSENTLNSINVDFLKKLSKETIVNELIKLLKEHEVDDILYDIIKYKLMESIGLVNICKIDKNLKINDKLFNILLINPILVETFKELSIYNKIVSKI